MTGADPGRSLPKQTGEWADLKGAYRFYSNPKVDACKIGKPHQALTRRRCAEHKVVLCIQDSTDLHGVKVKADTHVQHSALAATTQGQVLGLLHQSWFKRVERPEGETRAQAAKRWRESDVWQQTREAVGPGPEGCRLIHVCDAGADNLRFLHSFGDRAEAGFLVRAYEDRRIEGSDDKLWAWMSRQDSSGTRKLRIGEQRESSGKIKRRGREAQVQVRHAKLTLRAPWNHGDHLESLEVWVVYLKEVDPPADVEAVDWMLLTSEPVGNFEEACQKLDWYRQRWLIEEWHRVIKEGCRLEQSQMDAAEDLMRLAAVLSVIAVRMLELRDMAQAAKDGKGTTEQLRAMVPAMWIIVVAMLLEREDDNLTPWEWWLGIAKQGGFIGRKNDGLPGWKVIWRGWYDVQVMVRGAEAHQRFTQKNKRCG